MSGSVPVSENYASPLSGDFVYDLDNILVLASINLLYLLKNF